MKLVLSKYASCKHTVGQYVSLTESNWFEPFLNRTVRKSKDGPCVILAYVPRGRSAKNVEKVYGVGIDIEGKSDDEILLALDAIERFEYVLYTTHNHSNEKPRLRIVLPFGRPVSPDEYPSVWSRVNALVGGANDPQTKDLARLHFLPSCPPEREADARSVYHKGQWLIPEELPAATALDKPPSVVGSLHVEKLKRRVNVIPNANPIKEAFRSLFAGQPFALPGERHATILELTWAIVDRVPALPVEELEELFAPSLERMKAFPDPPTIDEVRVAFEGAAAKAARFEAETKKELCKEHHADEPDDERLSAIAERWECTVDELADRWILQHNTMYWILDPSTGEYLGPMPKDDALLVVRKKLVSVVDVARVTKTGFSYLPLVDIVTKSGRYVERHRASFKAQRTHYDATTNTIVEALRPLRPVGEKYDPQIDRWLRILARDDYARLVDWLACVPDLEKLLCAVYLDGPKACGKTLLATGLAKLWTAGGPADISLVMSDFNEEIARCPLVLADEEIPKTNRNQNITAQLRSMLSTTERTLARKYKPPTSIHGAVRLVLAANNEFLLDSRDVATSQDLAAIAQRFLYIRVTEKASTFLNAVPKTTRQRWATIGIAQHVLWLSNHHDVENPGSRFWVEGDLSQMHRILMTGSRWNSLVCEWLVRYLMKPSLYDAMKTGLIQRGDGLLLVNDQAVIDGWETYIRIRIEPETAKIGAALRAVSSTAERIVKNNGEQRVRYRVIDLDHLLTWSERYNIGDRDQLTYAVFSDKPLLRDPGCDDDDGDFVDEFASMPAVNEGIPF